MQKKRSPDVEHSPYAAAWLRDHPTAAENASRIIALMSSKYAGDNHGFFNRNQNFVDYRFSPLSDDPLIWSIQIDIRQSLATVRFYLNRSLSKGKWKSCIRKSATSTDLYALEFKLKNTDSIDSLRDFLATTLTFSENRKSILKSSSTEEKREEEILDKDAEEFDPDSLDAREWTTRSVVRRLGQETFRNKLLAFYGNQCVITGCKTVPVLEAAHITPYLGEHTNIIGNGLLLRSDLHVLWDSALVAINPQTHQVWISQEILADEYADLSGRKLDSNKLRMTDSALQAHWQWVHKQG